MGSRLGVRAGIVHFEQEVTVILGNFYTDSSGDTVSTGNDVWGNPKRLPKGIASITRTADGRYTVVLDEAWPKILNVTITGVSASVKAGTWKVISYNPTGATVNSIPAKTIYLAFEITGTAAAWNSLEAFLRIELGRPC